MEERLLANRSKHAWALALVLILGGCGGTAPTRLAGKTMGTTWSVKVADPVKDPAALNAGIEDELARVNGLMSTYIADSELSRFNRSPIGEWFPVHPDTVAVIRMAGRIHALSGGSFDVTVGPLVNLWGFGPRPGEDVVPTDEAIEAARSQVGFELLSIGEDALRRDAAIYVDLSAIAKGFGVDKVARVLDSAGYANYLVEIGGELRARGHNDRGLPWHIAIERPDAAQRIPFKTIDISDKGLATSGDYRNYFEVDGQRYSHTIDPVTARPITHSLASVTVIADTCTWADGLATAINVLGPERGLALAEAHNVAVFVIIKSPDGFVERHSPAFEAYLHD